MPLTVTNTNHGEPVGELTAAYLRKCGYSEEKIGSWTSKTRLLHDIGLCGDDVLDEFKILQDEFDVDLSDFEFEKYFPAEFSKGAYLISARRLLCSIGLNKLADLMYKNGVERICRQYPEVSFEMIESTLRRRKWVPATGI